MDFSAQIAICFALLSYSATGVAWVIAAGDLPKSTKRVHAVSLTASTAAIIAACASPLF